MFRSFMLALFVLPTGALAQQPVEYSVTFDGAAHHEARISVIWRNIGTAPLQLRMSRSSPGRYALHEFSKNVYGMEFVDDRGQPLTFTQPSPYQWDVAGHDGTVIATYTLYADRVDGTYSAVDLTHAHLNMPATFLWARGFDKHPIRIAFEPLPGWKIATQLLPTDDRNTYLAPDLQYFMDSPVELSDFSERSWETQTNGTPQTIHLIVHHDGSEDDVDGLLDKVRKVVEAETQVFGELPVFDHGEYWFIADYLPYAEDDGMEHRNSSVLTDPQPLDLTNIESQISTYSHEFFHVWNVERIRPEGLEPFDFERANVTPSLWFAEGFTSYYDTLVLARTGELTLDRYLEEVSDVINAVSSAPGRRYASPRGMSLQAALFDGAVSRDPNNARNSFFSYYTYGAAIGLALDLALRREFGDVTLDTFMQRMWQLHGKSESPYSPDDPRDVLAMITGERHFAEEFFERFISGRELPDYEALLAGAGLLLRTANPGTASPGPVSLEFDGDGARIAANTRVGTPLYEAGLDRGDLIEAIDRRRIRSRKGWDRAIARYEPDATATIRYLQRGIEKTAELTLREDPELEVVTYETTGSELNADQRAYRSSWLGLD